MAPSCSGSPSSEKALSGGGGAPSPGGFLGHLANARAALGAIGPGSDLAKHTSNGTACPLPWSWLAQCLGCSGDWVAPGSTQPGQWLHCVHLKPLLLVLATGPCSCAGGPSLGAFGAHGLGWVGLTLDCAPLGADPGSRGGEAWGTGGWAQPAIVRCVSFLTAI